MQSSWQWSSLLERLHLSFRRRPPVYLQSEAAECGLACLASISAFYGRHLELRRLRAASSVSLKGASLSQLGQIAQQLDLNSRPVKLELEQLSDLSLPCILHWNFNHYVVLTAVHRNRITVVDPAFGIRTLPLEEVSVAFTGIALEVWPAPAFKQEDRAPTVRMRQLLGNVVGLRRSLIQVLILALSLEVFMLTQPLFVHWVIDNAIVSADDNLLVLLALGFSLVIIFKVLIGAARSWLSMYISTSLGVQLKANIFAHLIRLPVAYFEQRSLGDISSRFNGVSSIQAALSTRLVEGLLDGLMASLTLAAMFIYSVPLTLFVLCAVGLSTLMSVLWQRARLQATQEQVVHAAKQSGHFLETVRGVKAIKLFQRETDRQNTWLGALVNEINAGLALQKVQIKFDSIRELILGLENIVFIFIGASLVIDQRFTVGALMAIYSYKGMFEQRFSGLIDWLIQLSLLKVPAERLSDIVLTAPDGPPARSSLEQESSPPGVSFVGVRFKYAEHEPLVLDGVTFEVAPGESVAISGPSGSGKTTLVNLLLGILTPSQGQIFVGGVQMGEAGSDSLRGVIGTVLQDDILFAGSIAENISFFDPQPDYRWIEECARRAAVHEDIMTMPMRYFTLVGDLGSSLSGGQRQRVLLARAFYKRPKILVLDEATSHLDLQREKAVVESIRSMRLTKIFVAHRPDTLASADRVLTLSGGTISEIRVVTQLSSVGNIA